LTTLPTGELHPVPDPLRFGFMLVQHGIRAFAVGMAGIDVGCFLFLTILASLACWPC
jgi:hypothetical protein